MYVLCDDEVQEGTQLVENIEASQMRFGEISDRL
jgi:hypothetical protein